MNEFSGYALKRGIGWWAMLRFARDARPHPLMAKGARPYVFETECEAWKAVAQHAFAFMNGHEIRGERFDGGDQAKARAESFFKPRPAASEREKVSA